MRIEIDTEGGWIRTGSGVRISLDLLELIDAAPDGGNWGPLFALKAVGDKVIVQKMEAVAALTVKPKETP